MTRSDRPSMNNDGSRFSTSLASHINNDIQEFSDNYDSSAPSVGLDMAGHDTYLMGAKVVMLDSFVVDLLNVDTSAQTFRLKLLLNMDWEDDGTIEPEVKAKRNLGRGNAANQNNASFVRHGGAASAAANAYNRAPSIDGSTTSAATSTNNNTNTTTTNTTNTTNNSTYKTGKYVLKQEFVDDPLGTTWNPEVVLANAIADENPIEVGSKLHAVQMLSGRPVVSRSVLYQPECRCEFTFSNFPFDETDLVVKFSSNKWNSEQVQFMWSHRLDSMGKDSSGRRISRFGNPSKKMSPQVHARESVFLKRSVDQNAIGGVGLSEFEIIKVRVETDEKDVNSMQRYDNAEGEFSEAHLIIRVRRDPYSYLLRVGFVAELLMFLEVLSFVTDDGDLSARFSISGTIFLAMVSLYGPMADALPKVSVVTRVDKWHIQNFILLFASNVENLMAFVLRHIINDWVLDYSEWILGILYLYLVVKNLVWFIKPLQDREEYTELVAWCEDKVDDCKDKMKWFVDKIFPWRFPLRRKKEEGADNGNGNGSPGSKWSKAVKGTAAAIRIKNGAKDKESDDSRRKQNQTKTPNVTFDSFKSE